MFKGSGMPMPRIDFREGIGWNIFLIIFGFSRFIIRKLIIFTFRLFNAARKALTRIPTMTITPGMNQELQSDCAVCLDPYQLQDVIRLLPCK